MDLINNTRILYKLTIHILHIYFLPIHTPYIGLQFTQLLIFKIKYIVYMYIYKINIYCINYGMVDFRKIRIAISVQYL
jgi:hypothetical protein